MASRDGAGSLSGNRQGKLKSYKVLVSRQVLSF